MASRKGSEIEVGFGIGNFLNFNHQASSSGMDMTNSMMNDIFQTGASQMKSQTEMGQLNMMIKMNEALAKMFKALGDAIKGLAG